MTGLKTLDGHCQRSCMLRVMPELFYWMLFYFVVVNAVFLKTPATLYFMAIIRINHDVKYSTKLYLSRVAHSATCTCTWLLSRGALVIKI